MNTLIQRGRKVFCYKNWISEKGVITRVTPLEFVRFKYQMKKKEKWYPYYVNGETVIGEIWQCLTEDGNIINCIFKHTLDKAHENTSLEENKSPLRNDFEPNLLIDAIEEWLSSINKRKYPNKQLLSQNRKHFIRIKRLNEIVNSDNVSKEEKIVAFYILRHKQSPTIQTLRAVQKVKNSREYEKIMQQINDF